MWIRLLFVTLKAKRYRRIFQQMHKIAYICIEKTSLYVLYLFMRFYALHIYFYAVSMRLVCSHYAFSMHQFILLLCGGYAFYAFLYILMRFHAFHTFQYVFIRFIRFCIQLQCNHELVFAFLPFYLTCIQNNVILQCDSQKKCIAVN